MDVLTGIEACDINILPLAGIIGVCVQCIVLIKNGESY